jgi:nitrate/nitrite transport system permease protein
MLVGGTGIGYFVWNEWNNLSLTRVIFAILVIGTVGLILDLGFNRLAKAISYTE